jgi:hypothetical protein
MRQLLLFSKTILVALMLVALAGCSSIGLLYRNADTLALFYVSRYITLTDEQSLLARRTLADFFRWHRSSELPKYAVVLDGLSADMARDLSPEQACKIGTEVRTALDRAMTKLMPPLAEMAVSITPAQIREVEQSIVKNNAKWDKDNREISREAQIEKRLKSARERYLDEYGSFNDAQAKYLTERIKASPWSADGWAKDRAENQARMMRMIKAFPNQNPGAAQAALTAYFKDLESPSDAKIAERQQITARFNCETAAGMHQRADGVQRAFAQKRLKSYSQQLRELASS